MVADLQWELEEIERHFALDLFYHRLNRSFFDTWEPYWKLENALHEEYMRVKTAEAPSKESLLADGRKKPVEKAMIEDPNGLVAAGYEHMFDLWSSIDSARNLWRRSYWPFKGGFDYITSANDNKAPGAYDEAQARLVADSKDRHFFGEVTC